MSPAAAKTERSLRARVEIAQAHADPDIRALAEMVLSLAAQVQKMDEALQVLDDTLTRVEALAVGDGK